MLVRLKTIMAGPDGCVDAGKVADLPEAAAKELVDAGFADLVTLPADAAADDAETAAVDPSAETATVKSPKPRKPKAEASG